MGVLQFMTGGSFHQEGEMVAMQAVGPKEEMLWLYLVVEEEQALLKQVFALPWWLALNFKILEQA